MRDNRYERLARFPFWIWWMAVVGRKCHHRSLLCRHYSSHSQFVHPATAGMALGPFGDVTANIIHHLISTSRLQLPVTNRNTLMRKWKRIGCSKCCGRFVNVADQHDKYWDSRVCLSDTNKMADILTKHERSSLNTHADFWENTWLVWF